jgi:hypothetical protein
MGSPLLRPPHLMASAPRRASIQRRAQEAPFESLPPSDSGRVGEVRFTRYFLEIRTHSDRAAILDEWIERAMVHPLQEEVQTDGRIRRWVQIPEMEGRFLRVVLLPDGETVHNAFFDRRFKP